MWPWQRQRTRGSPIDPKDRLIQALEENNALLRLELERHGIKVTTRRQIPISDGPTRKRQATDVTVVTRDVIEEQQAKANEARRLEDSPG